MLIYKLLECISQYVLLFLVQFLEYVGCFIGIKREKYLGGQKREPWISCFSFRRDNHYIIQAKHSTGLEKISGSITCIN